MLGKPFACPIFTLGGTNNYTVSGIFTDAGAIVSAGTYVLAGNKFTVNNTISSGSQMLYAKVTDGTCTFTVPFDFNNVKPTAVLVNNTTVCTGANVTLSGTCSSGTISWYITATGGSNIGTGTSLSNSPTVATTYYAACESTNCVSCRVATSGVTISSLPTATASSNSPICAGTTLSLTGGATGNTYPWSGSSSFTSTAQNPTIPNATDLMSGVYILMITNANGCTNTATTSATVNPIVNHPVPQANTQIAFGASITLTATGCSRINDVLKWYKSSDNFLAIMPVSPTATTNYCEQTTNLVTCLSPKSNDVTVINRILWILPRFLPQFKTEIRG